MFKYYNMLYVHHNIISVHMYSNKGKGGYYNIIYLNIIIVS